MGGGLEGYGLESGSDSINYNHAYGRVSTGKDIYTFKGDLDVLEIRGDVRVYLDGKLLRGEPRDQNQPSDDDPFDGLFRVVGADESESAWSVKINGRLRSHAFESTDSINGGWAHGMVTTRGGADAVEYAGRLMEMDVIQSSAKVYLNHVLVAGGPENENHVLRIDGAGASDATTYFIEVHGGLDGSRLESNDSVRYNRAEGLVGGSGYDAFTFKGDLDELRVYGPGRVYLDGQLIRGDGPTELQNFHLDMPGFDEDPSSQAACSAGGTRAPMPVGGGVAAALLLLVGAAWRRRGNLD